MTDTSITRIAVLGDSGVGKTSLLSVLCHKAVLKSPSWTVGCAIEVLLHGDSCIELRDVGGGKAQHRRSRAIFYKDVHALILVHDLTNRKSCDNLRKWVAEFLASKEPTGVTTVSSSSRLKSRTSSSESVPDSMMSTLNPTPGTISTSTSELPLSSVPMLIIGTKCDLVSPADLRERRVPIADSANADSIFVSCMDPLAFSAGTGKRIERFLERAVESQSSVPAAVGAGKHRFNALHVLDHDHALRPLVSSSPVKSRPSSALSRPLFPRKPHVT